MQRLKTTVDQVRTTCTNDVRKRDREIVRLKSHLTSQQRGNKTGLVGASITINPGTMGLGGATSSVREDVPNVDDPEYSLKQETTEFLTHLSQSLSDENDSLIGLVRSTLLTLKELQGMSEQNARADSEEGSDFGENDDNDEGTGQGMLHTLPTNYEALADDMDTVLDNLKNLLTNPNFVSVEEVELREEEIHRLRAGWEKMEARLRESFMLMDSWRKRMTNGDTIDLEELRMGLGFGQGLDTSDRQGIPIIEEEEEDEDEDEAASSVFDEEVDDTDVPQEDEDEQSEVEHEPSPEVEDMAPKKNSADMFKIKLQPTPAALRESNGNKSLSRSPRKVAFSPSIPNTPCQVEDENAEESGIDLVGAEKSSRSSSAVKPPTSEERAPRRKSRDDRTPRSVRNDRLTKHMVNMGSIVFFPCRLVFVMRPMSSACLTRPCI